MKPLFPSLLAIAFVLGVPTLSAADISWSRGTISEGGLRFVRSDTGDDPVPNTGKKSLTACKSQSLEQNNNPRFWCPDYTAHREYKQFLWHLYDTKKNRAAKLRTKNPLLGNISGTKKDEHDRFYAYSHSYLTSEQSTYESRFDLSQLKALHQQIADEFIRGRVKDERIQENYESILEDMYRLQTIVKME